MHLFYDFLLKYSAEHGGHGFKVGNTKEILSVDFVNVLLVRVDRRCNEGHALARIGIADMLEVAFCRVTAVIIVVWASVGDDDKDFLVLTAFQKPFASENHCRAVAVAAPRLNIHQPVLIVAVKAVKILVIEQFDKKSRRRMAVDFQGDTQLLAGFGKQDRCQPCDFGFCAAH